MKAAQDFTVYVDSEFNRINHSDGEPLPEKVMKLDIKKGGEVPAGLLSSLLQFNRDYLDLSTATPEELQLRKKKLAPIISPRKYSQSSLNADINKMKYAEAVAYLKNILKKEFGKESKEKKTGILINEVLVAQEQAR